MKYPIFAKNLNIVLEKRKLTVPQFARLIKEPYKTVNAWQEGRSLPRADKLPKIAEVLRFDPVAMIAADITKKLKEEKKVPYTVKFRARRIIRLCQEMIDS
jgi:transcriptional regulator with XRE-family HTH domain